MNAAIAARAVGGAAAAVEGEQTELQKVMNVSRSPYKSVQLQNESVIIVCNKRRVALTRLWSL